MPRPPVEILYGAEVGQVLPFDYLNLGASDKMEVGGLVDGGFDRS